MTARIKALITAALVGTLCACTQTSGGGSQTPSPRHDVPQRAEPDSTTPDVAAPTPEVIQDTSADVSTDVPAPRSWSCDGRCEQTSPRDDQPCQCDAACTARDDCCFDYVGKCNSGLLSCQDRCGQAQQDGLPCQCDALCGKRNDCCSDWASLCEAAVSTCQGQCGTAYDPAKPCQCSANCAEFNNCCDDFDALCPPILSSCQDRCAIDYQAELPCQCNTTCAKFGNCCDDYLGQCAPDTDLDWIKETEPGCAWHTVVQASDGDTLIIDTGDKVRLVAVDTPEITGSPECYGWAATDYTRDTLEGATVCLVADPQQPDTDDFGRLLRNVFYNDPAVPGALVLHDARLVRLGYAQPHYAYIFSSKYAETTVFMALLAQQENKGGWGQCGWE